MSEKRKKTGRKNGVLVFLTLLTLLLGGLDIGCWEYLCLPDSLNMTAEELNLPSALFPARAAAARQGEAAPAAADMQPGGSETLELQILNGALTVKSITVRRNEALYVVPGGQAIGILLQTDGVTVVGLSPVIREDGHAAYPAHEAGIQTGDFITAVNGQSITYDMQMAEQVQRCGARHESVQIDYIRDQEHYSAQVEPQFCTDTQSWRIGLYVRDNTAGVGTLTFWEPLSGKYGALGHKISDPEGRESEGEDKGSIIKAAIQGIRIGEAGDPGEKLGAFISDAWRGSIEKNCLFGIYGTLQDEIYAPYSAAVPVACCNEVETGAAQIYTVLDGQKIECFDIEIVKLLPNYKLSGKGMIIEVTDEELLRRSGGIVQGMSGSPIIQNGRLVGAVTHVFINDPRRGYGCMAEWMMQEAGLWD